MSAASTEPRTAAQLLRSFLELVEDRRADDARDLLDEEFEGVVPAASREGRLDRDETVSWFSDMRTSWGTMRLEPIDMILDDLSVAAAVVAQTAFDASGDGTIESNDAPLRWRSLATIATAHVSERSGKLDRVTFVTDDVEGRDKATCEGVVRGWYAAHAGQSERGVVGALSTSVRIARYSEVDGREALDHPAALERFAAWCDRHRRGGVVVERVVTHAPYVATVVQFLSQERASGLQTLTRELHVVRLDASLEIQEAHCYGTRRLGEAQAVRR